MYSPKKALVLSQGSKKRTPDIAGNENGLSKNIILFLLMNHYNNILFPEIWISYVKSLELTENKISS